MLLPLHLAAAVTEARRAEIRDGVARHRAAQSRAARRARLERRASASRRLPGLFRLVAGALSAATAFRR